MIEAAIWGAIGASTLLIGAALAFTIDLPPRIRGLILAFGAGALFGAVAYELFEEAVRASMGGYDVLFGFAAGAIVFFLGSVAIDRLGSGRSDGAGLLVSFLGGLPGGVRSGPLRLARSRSFERSGARRRLSKPGRDL